MVAGIVVHLIGSTNSIRSLKCHILSVTSSGSIELGTQWTKSWGLCPSLL